MFEMIMTVNKTLYGKIFVLKKNQKIVLQMTEIKFSYLECMLACLFVVSAFIASGDI